MRHSPSVLDEPVFHDLIMRYEELIASLDFPIDCHTFMQLLSSDLPFVQALKQKNPQLIKDNFLPTARDQIVVGDVVLFTATGYNLAGSHSAKCVAIYDGQPYMLSKYGASGAVHVVPYGDIFHRYPKLVEQYRFSKKS